MLNTVIGIRTVCSNPETLIAVVDIDDALADRTAVQHLRQLEAQEHDLILAAPFRPDAPTKIYRPSFKDARRTFGGDVWIHLRAFKKHLFDQLPDSMLQLDGHWLQKCEDYATMLPLAELARNPVYIPEYLYWHERTTIFDDAERTERNDIIERILSKATPAKP